MARLARFWLEFRSLFLLQLLEQRGWLLFTVITSTLWPFLLVFGLGRMGAGQTAEGMAYVITGSAVVTLTTTGINVVAQNLGAAKDRGDFLFLAALPVSKVSYLLALLISKLLLQLPGILVALVAGSWLYHFPLAPNPLLLAIIVLAALSLSGVGAALGLLSPDFQLTQVVGNLVMFLVMFASPVFITPEQLPPPLRLVGLLLPPTYAADALRRVATGVTDLQLGLDVAVLLLWAVASLGLVARGLRWRLP